MLQLAATAAMLTSQLMLHQGETFNERALLNLFRAVIANNRAGGWRTLRGSQ